MQHDYIGLLIKGEAYHALFYHSQMVINSALAVFLATPEMLMIRGYADAVSRNDLGIDQVSLLCDLITETHTVTCSLISNLTGCSQSR